MKITLINDKHKDASSVIEADLNQTVYELKCQIRSAVRIAPISQQLWITTSSEKNQKYVLLDNLSLKEQLQSQKIATDNLEISYKNLGP
jgi:hypothetical protein